MIPILAACCAAAVSRQRDPLPPPPQEPEYNEDNSLDCGDPDCPYCYPQVEDDE